MSYDVFVPGLELTEYGREHADECCLKFTIKSETTYDADKFEYSGEEYLDSEVNTDKYVEFEFDPDYNENCLQDADEIMKQIADINEELDKQKKVRREMSVAGCDTFAKKLKFHMKRRGITVETLAERSHLSDTTITNYRTGIVEQPPVENVMAICIGLNLARPYCEDLLTEIGFTLNDSRQGRAFNLMLDHTDATVDFWNEIMDGFKLPHIPKTN